MGYLIKSLSILFLCIAWFQASNAEEVIAFRCDFKNIQDESEDFALLISREDNEFYLLSNYGGERGKLLLHTPDENSTIDSLFPSLAKNNKVTFVEFISSGGVNTISINISTKEAWHSRHTDILSQYKGFCQTDIF